jgi:predicted nucleotidyltransferase
MVSLLRNPPQHHPAADETAELLRDLAEKHLPHARLWLFGSRAKGVYHRRSDFDLAVEPKPGFGLMEYHRFVDAVEQESRIPYRVDVHLMAEIPDSWAKTIVQQGVLWKS